MNESAGKPQTLPVVNAAGAYLGQLNEITDELLTQEHPGKLRDAALRLYDLFSGITGVGEQSDSPEDLKETILPTGKAISPKNAGRCAAEFVRTAKFLKGLNAALLELQRRFPGEPLEILYAGCGPFATLLVPLLPQFEAGCLRITLLDIHDHSLRAAELVFKTFELEDHLAGCTRADAAAYRHPRPLHLVVTETMLAALQKEPQVAVTYNLAPQLLTGGILVPEKITVDACLYNPATEMTFIPAEASRISLKEPEQMQSRRVRIKLGRIFELTAKNPKDAAGGKFFAPVIVDLPKEADEKLKLMLATTVTIFETTVLEEYESSITYPYLPKEQAPAVGGSRIEFTYRSGRDPGFGYRYLTHGQEASV